MLATAVVTGKRAGGAANAPPAADGGAPDVAAPVSFTGTWPTISGGTHPYTVKLQQVGNKVTGTYSPGNGKIFDGVVVGRSVAFKWTQDGGYEGTAEFTLDQDGKGFTGSTTALSKAENSVSNGRRTAACLAAGSLECGPTAKPSRLK